MREKRSGTAFLFLVAGIELAAAAPASAQAWLPPKGEASFSLGGQNLNARYHLLWDGRRDDRGKMEWYHAISDLTYGVTDRFAVRVGIPYVFSRYAGNFPHRPVGRPVHDDGQWHSTFQDFRIEARYMAATGSLVATPFLSIVLPSSGYEFLSHVAAGRHLREYAGGVSLGRRLDPVLPDTYAQAQLSFTMAQRVLGIWHNKNNADVEVGHFLSPSVAVRMLGAWQWTHGGFRIPLDAPAGSANFQVHDQLAKDSHFILGGGVSYAVNGSLDLSATVFKVMTARNSNEVRGISVGTTWGFSPAQMIRRRKGAAPTASPDAP